MQLVKEGKTACWPSINKSNIHLFKHIHQITKPIQNRYNTEVSLISKNRYNTEASLTSTAWYLRRVPPTRCTGRWKPPKSKGKGRRCHQDSTSNHFCEGQSGSLTIPRLPIYESPTFSCSVRARPSGLSLPRMLFLPLLIHPSVS